MLGGVCGGLAEVYDMDPTIVRLLTVLIVIGTGVGPVLYLVAWLVMPTESEVKEAGTKVEEVEIREEDSDDGEEQGKEEE